MKMIIAPEGRSAEILSPYDGKWYKKGREYDVDFSTAMRLKRDPEFKIDMPYEKFPFHPETWSEGKQAAFISDIDPISGWGNVTTNLIRFSPDIKFAQIGKRWGVKDPAVIAAAGRIVNPNSAAVWHDQPKSEWIMTPFGRNIAVVPFETTRVPNSWVTRLNAMDAVLVPCKQNIGMMIDSGVTKPVELIHWGVDTDRFHPVKRRTNRPFTFGHMGALSIRKGTDILVRAFQAAFPHEKDVRLLCKTTNKTFNFWVKDDNRIEVNFEHMSQEDLIEQFFGEIDCFVYPTRGEGFGLTIPEAMATGVPAIATGWSGPVEYMTPETGWTLDYTMDAAKEFQELYREPCGDWAIPSFDHLVHLMRHAYQNQEETRDKGALAAAYIQNEWTWKKQIPMFHEALDRHLI